MAKRKVASNPRLITNYDPKKLKAASPANGWLTDVISRTGDTNAMYLRESMAYYLAMKIEALITLLRNEKLTQQLKVCWGHYGVGRGNFKTDTTYGHDGRDIIIKLGKPISVREESEREIRFRTTINEARMYLCMNLRVIAEYDERNDIRYSSSASILFFVEGSRNFEFVYRSKRKLTEKDSMNALIRAFVKHALSAKKKQRLVQERAARKFKTITAVGDAILMIGD